MTTKSAAKTRRLESVAYHEAGHAVACHAYRIPIRRVSIAPNAESLGRVTVRVPGSFVDYPTLTTAQRRRLEGHILMSYAGPEAERRFTGRYNHVGAEHDYNAIAVLANRVYEFGATMDAYLAWLRARARDFIATPAEWLRVEGLAKALLAKTSLEPAQVRQAIVEVDQRLEHDPTPLLAMYERLNADEAAQSRRPGTGTRRRRRKSASIGPG